MAAHAADRRVPRASSQEVADRPDVLVARLAAEQDGVICLAQLLACGVSAGGITSRLRNGHLHRLHRGVYAVGHVALSARGRLRAAMLACGDGAVVSHFSAAAFWELVGWGDRTPQVSVMTGSAGRRVGGVCVHRRRSLAPCDVWTRSGMRLTSPARTLLDIAADLSGQELRRAVRQAQAENRVNVRQLVELLGRADGLRGTAALRRVVADGPAPTRSELEDAVLELIRRVTGEPFEVNAMLRLAGQRPIRPDFLWRDIGLVIEADGAAWHDDRLAREDDAARQAALEAHGFRVLRITWTQAVRHPRQTLDRIAHGLGAARA
jgi:very-short-patch-repair endonuclease/predicted transcriptional regulator of viral defense system